MSSYFRSGQAGLTATSERPVSPSGGDSAPSGTSFCTSGNITALDKEVTDSEKETNMLKNGAVALAGDFNSPEMKTEGQGIEMVGITERIIHDLTGRHQQNLD